MTQVILKILVKAGLETGDVPQKIGNHIILHMMIIKFLVVAEE